MDSICDTLRISSRNFQDLFLYPVSKSTIVKCDQKVASKQAMVDLGATHDQPVYSWGLPSQPQGTPSFWVRASAY